MQLLPQQDISGRQLLGEQIITAQHANVAHEAAYLLRSRAPAAPAGCTASLFFRAPLL